MQENIVILSKQQYDAYREMEESLQKGKSYVFVKNWRGGPHVEYHLESDILKEAEKINKELTMQINGLQYRYDKNLRDHAKVLLKFHTMKWWQFIIWKWRGKKFL